jgi:hypothetical protein
MSPGWFSFDRALNDRDDEVRVLLVFQSATLKTEEITMGSSIQDTTTSDMIYLLNKRFGIDGILEMVELQTEFHVFSADHSLQHSFGLLGITPCDPFERERWYKFLELLKTYPSDLPKVNGHDRVVKAYKDNLEGEPTICVFIDVHLKEKDPRVTVYEGQPILYSLQTYLVISIPVTPAPLFPPHTAEAGKKPRAAKSKK